MSIKETLQKIKPLYGVLLIVAISSVFFALGRLSGLKKAENPVKIGYDSSYNEEMQSGTAINSLVATTSRSGSSPQLQATTTGEVIGSKSGKKYYFPWCGTVKRIKPENQIHFASVSDAKAAGFTPGGNCKGLQ